ncbi:MAG TPA: YraN family protein [Candidatus Saccharimonadales bacterium]|nr:YraN family protein [Candidatus Saccharimonadales bacterium]
MSFQGKSLGQTGEKLAANLLRAKKLQILATNLQTKFGEIDILARDGQQLVVVEVKAKTSARYGAAIEMITHAKQRKLILLAHELQAKHQTDGVRIDIITVDNAQSENPIIKHHKGLIEFNG